MSASRLATKVGSWRECDVRYFHSDARRWRAGRNAVAVECREDRGGTSPDSAPLARGSWRHIWTSITTSVAWRSPPSR